MCTLQNVPFFDILFQCCRKLTVKPICCIGGVSPRGRTGGKITPVSIRNNRRQAAGGVTLRCRLLRRLRVEAAKHKASCILLRPTHLGCCIHHDMMGVKEKKKCIACFNWHILWDGDGGGGGGGSVLTMVAALIVWDEAERPFENK